jgi:hypothetical protein
LYDNFVYTDKIAKSEPMNLEFDFELGNSKLTAPYTFIIDNDEFSEEAERNDSGRSRCSSLKSNKRTFQRRLDFEEECLPTGKL